MTYQNQNTQTNNNLNSEAHQRASKAKRTTHTTRKDIKQEITDQIVELMEAGVEEWQRMWEKGARSGLPISGATGKPYRGVNIIMLWSAAVRGGFSSNIWLTFKQAKDLGAKVKKGSKSTQCIYFDLVKKKKENPADDDEFYPMTKKFNLFNLEQLEEIPEDFLQKIEAQKEARKNDFTPIEEVEMFIKNADVEIMHYGDRACYVPRLDKIVMPNPETFTSEENYYATLLHELTHSTGHESRLDRDMNTDKQSEDYAFEELIAELGAAFLSGHFGFIDATVENHASYLDFWVKQLKNDKNLIFSAAAQAGKAFDFLLQAEKKTAEIH